MTLISQTGYVVVINPCSIEIKEHARSGFVILLTARSGKVHNMAWYSSLERAQEILETVLYWMKNPGIGGRITEIRFPKA